MLERFVVVASLPGPRVAEPAERQFLARVVGSRGRSHALFNGLWLALLHCASARREASDIREKLVARYGAEVRVLIAPAPRPVQLSAAQISGTAPLPPPLPELVARLKR